MNDTGYKSACGTSGAPRECESDNSAHRDEWDWGAAGQRQGRESLAMPRAFRTVLVANRGEIAMRVLRTVKAMGLTGAVIYHAADRDAPAVAAADLAIPINGSTPVGAYLDADEILRAATEANADAIHPGYGFLSENAAFARRV